MEYSFPNRDFMEFKSKTPKIETMPPFGNHFGVNLHETPKHVFGNPFWSLRKLSFNTSVSPKQGFWKLYSNQSF